MIYVFRIGSLGDSLVTLPALKSIKRQYPDDKITLITHVASKDCVSCWDVLKYAEVFTDVLFFELDNITSIVNIALAIRKTHTRNKLYYVQPFRARSQVMKDYFLWKILANFDEIIGLSQSRYPKLREENGKLLVLESEYDRLLKIVSPIKGKKENNIKCEDKLPLLQPQKENYQVIKEMLPPDSKSKTMVAISFGSNMASKQWPIDRFHKLISELNKERQDLFFVLVGGNKEVAEGESLSNSFDNCTSFAGKTSVIESAALLEKCTLFIGNDTGTMHLAAIMGTPVIALFSARDNPGKWEPYGMDNHIIMKKVECAGCMLTSCHEFDNKCIKLITVHEVLQLANESLPIKPMFI